MPLDPIAQPVDYILLANRRSPGIAEVTGASSDRQWDIRKGFALSGARLRYKGLGLATFTVTLKLVSSADWAAWHDWRALVQRPPVGVRARAQDIWHPILEDLEISQAVIQKVGQPNQAADGVFEIPILFLEHRAPVRINEEINGSEEAPVPLTRQQLVIQELTQQLQARGDILRGLQGR